MDFVGEREQLSGVVVAALDDATRSGDGRRADTRDVLLALMVLDAEADWRRLWVSLSDDEGLAEGRGDDPDLESDLVWRGAPLTGTCAGALTKAVAIGRRDGLLPVPAGLLALCLAEDPGGAAGRALSAHDVGGQQRFVDLTQSTLPVLRDKRDGPGGPAEWASRAMARASDVWDRHLHGWRRRAGAAAVLVVLVVAAVWVVLPSTGHDYGISGVVKVRAKTRHGSLRVTLLAEQPVLTTADPIGKAVHIDRAHAELDGTATITFPVGALEKKFDPAQDVAIAARGPETGNRWQVLGGDYDPGTRSISLQTAHFSDWVAVLTSPLKLAKAVLAKVFGGAPSPSCPGEAKGVYVAAHEIAACLSAVGGPLQTLEISNGSGIPLVLTLPASVKAVSENSRSVSRSEKIWNDFIESARQRPTLAPESKRTFSVDPAGFTDAHRPEEKIVTAELDLPSYLFDMVDFLAQVALNVDLDDAVGLVSRASAPTQCVYDAAVELRKPGGTSGMQFKQFVGYVGGLIKSCYKTVVSGDAAAAVRAFAKTAAKSGVRFLFRGLDLLLQAPEIGQRLTELLTTLNKLLTSGGYHPSVALFPNSSPKQLQAAIKDHGDGHCDSPNPLNPFTYYKLPSYLLCVAVKLVS
jgi:hypothetical protein